jgi:hypothetical protein
MVPFQTFPTLVQYSFRCISLPDQVKLAQSLKLELSTYVETYNSEMLELTITKSWNFQTWKLNFLILKSWNSCLKSWNFQRWKSKRSTLENFNLQSCKIGTFNLQELKLPILKIWKLLPWEVETFCFEKLELPFMKIKTFILEKLKLSTLVRQTSKNWSLRP